MLRFKDERGVAMITVLLVASVLTVLTTMAAFSTIKEMKSSTDDRKGAEALSYAEAGVDRVLQYLRTENLTWSKLIRAGCEDPGGIQLPTGLVGGGSFTAVLKVFKPNPPTGNAADRFAPAACNYRASSANDPVGQYFVITSKGTRPTASRTVQQVIKVVPLGLPVGIYAPTIEASGTPNMSGISMITEGQIRGRDKLVFTGTDPYYYMQDVFPGGLSGRSPTEHVPAAAHALGGIYLKQNGTSPQFPGPTAPTTRNCTAQSGGQSLWDSDGSAATGTVTAGCAGQIGYPLNSKFTTEIMDAVRPSKLTEEEHQALKDVAKSDGIYCSIGATTQCSVNGTAISGMPGVWNDTDIAPEFAAGENNFVAYFDFLTGDTLTNSIKWHANVWPCNPTNADLSKSVVLVVRRGGLEVQGSQINGALILDGQLKYNGSPTINGTIISDSAFSITGGANFTLDDCWVKNMPAPLLGARPVAWSELDR